MSVHFRYPIVKIVAKSLVGIVALTPVFGAQAEICKWVDKDGNVHYAETCPEGIQGTEVEMPSPPSQSQIDAASGRYVNERPQSIAQPAGSFKNDEPLSAGTDQLLDFCVAARVNLDALSQKYPVFFDQTGRLRPELHKSVRLEFDRSGKHLNSSRRAEQVDYWKEVERINCSPDMRGSAIRSKIRQEQEAYQQRECAWWGSELEYMERKKSFHKERLHLKKLFNAKCK